MRIFKSTSTGSFIGMLLFVAHIQSCCSCEERFCELRDAPTLSLTVNLDNYPQLTRQDFEVISIVQKDKNFVTLDSLISGFVSSSTASGQLELIVDFNMFSTIASEHYYIIHTIQLNQTDTISRLTYEVTTTEKTCNECTGGLACDDKTYTVYDFTNPDFDFNTISQQSFEVDFVVK